MNYVPDDLIGFGADKMDMVETGAKVVKKFGKFISKMTGKAKKAKRKIAGAVGAKPATVDQQVVTASAGGGIGEFIRKNPLPVAAGVGLLAIIFFARKRG